MLAVESPEGGEPIDEDLKLMNLGYKPMLSRSLDGFMSFAIGFTRINVVIGIAPLLGYGRQIQ